MTSRWPRPETLAGRILATLQDRPEGASDAELARFFGVQHQAVNAACRMLAMRGLLMRASQQGTLINRVGSREDTDPLASLEPEMPSHPPQTPLRPWYWEGNVQASVVDHLVRHDWRILQVANTVGRAPGNDIEAQRNGVMLWVTVKGFPVRTPKTQPPTQARHWFAAAIFDVVLWRQDAPRDVQFAIALPQFKTYETLAERTSWLKRETPFVYLWVSEASEVLSELDTS
jgi:hypothetical protein